MDIEDDIQDAFNFEVSKELMREVNSDVTDEDVRVVYESCNGNPWDAGILYSLFLESGRLTR